MIWVAATGVAIYLWLSNAGDAKLRAAAIVLGALSVQELWGHIFFNLVTFPLLRAETAFVGTIMEALRPGTMWHDNAIRGPNGFGIVIISSCSSFHNLSLAMLCWLTLSRLRHQDWRTRDFAIGGAIGVTMILFNVVRICLMGWDIDLYHYWHDGLGAEMYAIGASLTILLMSLYGSRPAGRAA
jgi:exosortase/archaeosortase family protein